MAFQQKIDEPDPFYLKFVTWNYGPTRESRASIRDKIVPLFFHQIKGEAFICHQEVTVIDESARKIFFPGSPEEDYFYQSRKERNGGSTRQAISFPYKLVPYSKEYNVRCERVMSDKATGGRYYSRLITVTCGDYEVSFVLVSLHAQYKQKEKEIELKTFLRKMCEIAVKEEVPVIVAGDFNLDVYNCSDEILKEFKHKKCHVVFAPRYKQGFHREHKPILDTFLVASSESTVKFHIPIPICPYGHKRSTKTELGYVYPYTKMLCYYSHEDYDDVFKEVTKHGEYLSVLDRQLDHDPVMVTIKFTPMKYSSIWCFYAVDKKWQLKACKKINLYLQKYNIQQSIKDEYRGDTSTHLRCPDFRSIWPWCTTDEYSLFHAFSYVITGSEKWHKKVCKEVFKHMHRIEDDLMGRYIAKRKYKDIYDYKASSISTQGTEVEIYTLADLLETNIYVYFYRDRWDRSNGEWHRYRPKSVTSDMSVYITNHYEVVRKQRKQ